MATVIDSKQEMLDGIDVVGKSLADNARNMSNQQIQAEMLALAKAAQTPEYTIDQFGNTVFFTGKGKHKKLDVAVGYLYNVDTAKNFINNATEYLNALRRRKINYYTATVAGSTYVPIIKLLARKFPMKLVKSRSDDVYAMTIKLDGENNNGD